MAKADFATAPDDTQRPLAGSRRFTRCRSGRSAGCWPCRAVSDRSARQPANYVSWSAVLTALATRRTPVVAAQTAIAAPQPLSRVSTGRNSSAARAAGRFRCLDCVWCPRRDSNPRRRLERTTPPSAVLTRRFRRSPTSRTCPVMHPGISALERRPQGRSAGMPFRSLHQGLACGRESTEARSCRDRDACPARSW
jgi:hypothetical protein